ncbi:class I SAM-dependent methyltransferase [Microvirga sp. Mcv34]|uniref:class I SAM-dependent methyltransferase n=1 Tax=Microvirga sp. Mcv34 TaxID=2926016 RepID=UPI0021CA9C75|nr:class I SAM-dependent methyltransferase [Microvirga sp. Mcv34]
MVTSFALSPESEFVLREIPLAVHRWLLPDHLTIMRPALTLRTGERIEFLPIDIQPTTVLELRFGRALSKISNDGMTLSVTALTAGTEHHLAVLPLTNDDDDVRFARLGLGHLSGRSIHLAITAGPGFSGDPESDWASLVDVTVAPAAELSLAAARAYADLRRANEIAHFSTSYDHTLYKERDRRAKGQDHLSPPATTIGPHADATSLAPAPVQVSFLDMEPLPNEDAFKFGSRLLQEMLAVKPPSFEARLAQKAQAAHGQPLRVLSICSGTAQVEAALLRSVITPVHLTLADINADLLARALSYMPAHVSTMSLVQDLNGMKLSQPYDIVICVSGIHHLVELEHIWRTLHDHTKRDGELWLIGEQVGPKGNCLAEPEYRVANELFCALPDHLRRNSVTGEVDQSLSNKDLSETTFEGIRSDEIETSLSRFFLPIEVYKRNCFLWRFIDLIYYQNYNLSDPDDKQLLKLLVQAEYAHHISGGWATELHGVYRPIY